MILRLIFASLLIGVSASAGQSALPGVPSTVTAGTAFSITTSGSGKAVFYIVGPGEAIRREVQLGDPISIQASDLHNAGHYTAALVGDSSTQTADFDVTASEPATISFLAKPSRLPVGLPASISGVTYIFDAFDNLVLQPRAVAFELSVNGGASQAQSVSTKNGVAWVKLNSAAKAGPAQFQARLGPVSEKRVVQQVSGDPCNLRMTARQSGNRIELETQPLLDCQGNAVPDGTIVTFKEAYNGTETTVDVPIKRGVAKTDMPDQDGALISVATGVVMGNEIQWRGGR
jgi:hypothetical protein